MAEGLHGLDELVDHVVDDLGGGLGGVHRADDLTNEIVGELLGARTGAKSGAIDALQRLANQDGLHWHTQWLRVRGVVPFVGPCRAQLPRWLAGA